MPINYWEIYMFKLILWMILLVPASVVYANSVNPCAPTDVRQPMRLGCSTLNANYYITISALSSPISQECPQEKRIESYTAKIQVYSKSNLPMGQLEIFNGNFSFKLGPNGDGFFTSASFGLSLTGCKSPAHGGMSIGNAN